MSVIPIGFAIRRNGSCLPIEVDCGATVSPFRGCCPSSTVCPNKINVDCCPPGVDCTPSLLEAPRCANATWTMYDNGGYFCCEPGTLGYNLTTTYSNGCMLPGVPPKNVQLLPEASQAVFASTTAASTSATAPPTSTSSPTSTSESSPSPSASPSSSNSLSTGTIIGLSVGIVLGVALLLALAFFFYRRRKNKSKQPSAGGVFPNKPQWETYAHELPQHDTRHELTSQTKGVSSQRPGEYAELPVSHVSEMPANSKLSMDVKKP